MSLSSSLNAGVAGLSANSARLAVISDNIANSATFGYRRAEVEFSSLVTPATQNAYSAGGVQANPFRDVATSGSLITTGNATDISVGGRGMLPVTDIEKVESPASERTFKLTATGSFKQDQNGYLVTATGLALLGFPTDSAGSIGSVTRDGASSLAPVRISPFLTAAQSTTRVSLGVNLPAGATEPTGDGLPFESPIEYFDSVGRENTLRIVYTPLVDAAGATNTWNVSFFDSAASDPAEPVSSLDLIFDASRTGRGKLLSVTPVDLSDPASVSLVPSVDSLNPAPPAGYTANHDVTTGITRIMVADGPIDVFIGSPAVDGGMIQLDAVFSPTNVTKDGAPAGTLSGLEFDEKGFLKGVYDTGQRVTLFQIPLADVPNPNGLKAENNQAFSLTPQSGNLFLWDASTGPVGSIESFALQESTVDVARELTDLIKTQRAYSSNATVIQTVDEMLQETTNLKR